MSNGMAEHPQDQSLLDDASTLLMFSKTSNSSSGSGDESKEDVITDIKSQKMTPTSSVGTASQVGSQAGGRNLHMSVMTSPGPASLALMDDDDDDDNDENNDQTGNFQERGFQRSDSSSERIRKNGNKKGMVAAAALAQAATMPLPLKRKADHDKKNKRRSSSSTSISADASVDNHDSKGEQDVKQEKREGILETESKTSKDTVNQEEVTQLDTNRLASVPESYIVDPDAGIITCICGYDDDDGFTIQCDHCFRWQHAVCYGIEDEKDAPDDFLCNTCKPRFVDVKMAKRKQLERIRIAQNKKRRRVVNTNIKEVKSKESMVDAKDSKNIPINETVEQRTEPVEHVPSTDPLTNIVLINAKEAYPTVYLPLEANDYKDRYANLFVNDHANDDWVIPYNKSKFKPLPVEIKPYSDTNHSRVFSGYPKLALYLKQSCDEGEYIEEFLGEIDFQRKYLEDPLNNYRIWGTAKPKVIFHPHWPIYIDARLSGNLTRYIRRSCDPNVELVTIKLTTSDNKEEIKFVLRALRYIGKGEEINIKWDWDLRHPIWKLINNNESIDSIEEPKRYLFIHSIDTILGSCDCACGSNSKDCFLLKVKRYSQSLYRSVKSKMNNRYKLNEILHGNKLQTKKQSPILSKLAHAAISDAARASEVLLRFNAEKLHTLEPISDVIDTKKSFPTNVGSIRGTKYRISETNSKSPACNFKGSLAFITNSSKFDESNVTDPADLAIPINPMTTEEAVSAESIEVKNTDRNSSIGQASGSSNYSAVQNTQKIGMENVPVPPLNIHQSQTKKKLSFADYKKKIKPT